MQYNCYQLCIHQHQDSFDTLNCDAVIKLKTIRSHAILDILCTYVYTYAHARTDLFLQCVEVTLQPWPQLSRLSTVPRDERRHPAHALRQGQSPDAAGAGQRSSAPRRRRHEGSFRGGEGQEHVAAHVLPPHEQRPSHGHGDLHQAYGVLNVPLQLEARTRVALTLPLPPLAHVGEAAGGEPLYPTPPQVAALSVVVTAVGDTGVTIRVLFFLFCSALTTVCHIFAKSKRRNNTANLSPLRHIRSL